MTPDQWQEVGLFVLGMGGALRRRRLQNNDLVKEQQTSHHNLAKSIADILTERVAKVEQIASHLEARIAVHATELNHTNQMTKDMRQDVATLQESLPDIKEVLDKTLNFFERQKAGALKEESIHGSGGMTAVKSKKEGE